MAEHTALPWEWDWKLKENSLEAECGIRHFDGNMAYSVVRCPKYQSEQQWKADARFIVTACNHFEEIKETLKELHIGLKIRLAQEAASWGANADKTTEFLSKHPTLNKLEALLAKLEATE